ncbi:MAG: uncharacterized membrane-anchored protein YhcB (DUF1043 family) [Halieaceae bacterium]
MRLAISSVKAVYNSNFRESRELGILVPVSHRVMEFRVYGIDVVVLTGLASLLVGLGAGLVFGRKLSADSLKQRELERHADRLAEEQKNYKHEVAEHFTDTAKLLRHLAESYRDVHNHLATGASTLCKDDRSGPILARLPDSILGDGGDKIDPSSVSQPLDYAPKSSPFETGMLNEEFGLEKAAKAAEAEAVEPERL